MKAKTFAAVLAAVATIGIVSTAGSAVNPRPVGTDVTPADTTGDHPPTTAFALKGKLGLATSALAYNAKADPSGTFEISGITAKSKVVKALLYLTDWQTAEDGTASATFAGASFGPAAPVTTDSGGDKNLGLYRFDVTSQVKGNGSYDYAASGIVESYVSALVVVYKNKSLQKNFIWINDGAENMCCDTTSESQYSGGRRGSSDGRLIIVTGADDNIGRGESGEVVAFNGHAVGGPLDGNLGHFASLLDLPVTGVGPSNKVSVFTPQDWFGWHLSILSAKRQ
jgi:hypothetical protein